MKNSTQKQSKKLSNDELANLIIESEKPVKTVIFGFVPNHTIVDDIYSETIEVVLLKFTTWDGRASFTTWMSTVAKNRVRDWLRKQKCHNKYDTEIAEGTIPNRANVTTYRSPLDIVIAKEQLDLLDQLLASLPQREYQALLLKQDGLSDTTIGNIIGLHQTRVSALLRDIRALMKAQLARG